MTSAPSQRTSTSTLPAHGSLLLDPSPSRYHYSYYPMSAQPAQQGPPSNYNPAAIHTWVQGVQSSSQQARQPINMNDPAIQAYMQAKLGLYQQQQQQQQQLQQQKQKQATVKKSTKKSK